jgi:hypothetical protein
MSAATSENDRYPRLDRDAIQGEITANPTGAARRDGKRLSTFATGFGGQVF